MDLTTAKQILVKDNPGNLYDVVQPALEVAGIRDLLVEGSFSKPEMFRYNCVRVLQRALGQRPELFYSYWDCFESKLDSPNSFHRSFAASAIALLSPVDKDCRLDAIFKHYLGMLNDPKAMVTRYFILPLGCIYLARPDFRSAIVNCLLGIDKTHHRPAQRETLKADILQVFRQVFDIVPAKDQERIRTFAKAQLQSSSPKARKTAKELLKRYL